MRREHFSSRLGFILLSAGCAIGIGNVWKFPWMAGQYGGGAFVLAYLVFLLILGVPTLTIPGHDILDTEDFIVSNLLLPGGSLLFILFCPTRYGWGWDRFLAEANEGAGLKLAKWLQPYMTYALPTIVAVILITGLISFFG